MRLLLAVFGVVVLTAPALSAQTSETLTLRGRRQTLHLYGPRTGNPIVLTSGDGGFAHLAPAVAAFLAARGFFVVGVDARAYLSSFTSGSTVLSPQDIPGDYRSLIEVAQHGRDLKPVLVGVSEGAGLSVLAAADPLVQATVSGVVTMGLPDTNELGWRWRDSIIYLTHGIPNEPSFHAGEYVARLGTLPLASLQSTHDEFVSAEDLKKVLGPPFPTRRLWMIEAADHGFTDNQPELRQRLLEAMEWIRTSRR